MPFCLTLGGHICLILGIYGQAHLDTRPKDKSSHWTSPIIKLISGYAYYSLRFISQNIYNLG